MATGNLVFLFVCYKVMKKDKTILNLIKRLKLINSFTSIEVIDYWESDLCGIEIKKGNQLVLCSLNKGRPYELERAIKKI